MPTDLELARQHFRRALSIIESLEPTTEESVRSSVLADARLSYGAGMRRWGKVSDGLPADATYADLRRLERRVRMALESEDEDRTVRYLMRREASAPNARRFLAG